MRLWISWHTQVTGGLLERAKDERTGRGFPDGRDLLLGSGVQGICVI